MAMISSGANVTMISLGSGPMERFNVPGTDEVWIVHAFDVCRQDQFCAIHRPSHHGMRAWPMHLRETGLIERVCSHGVGHPDPDSARYFNERGPVGSRGTWTIHGCCGCCQA